MSKKASNNFQMISKSTGSLSMALMVIFLLCGGIAGCIFSLSAQQSSELLFFQSDIVSLAKNEVTVFSFWSTYFNLTKYLFIIFLLSFTVFGYIIIPIIVSLKSFFLTFSISTVLQLYGIKCFFLSMSMFGIQAFLSIPTLLLTAASGVEISKCFSVFLKNPNGNNTNKNKLILKYVIVFFTLMLALLLFTFLDITVTPLLVSLSLK